MNGIVYAIMDKDDKIMYIGSTINLLCQRIAKHKYRSKTETYLLYTYINNNGGWSNYTFKVLEDYECEKIENLRERERYYFDLHNPKLNMARPTRTKKECYNQCRTISKKRSATKINCECNGRYSLSQKARHLNSIKHQTYIQAINI
jgi:hypothetical protein